MTTKMSSRAKQQSGSCYPGSTLAVAAVVVAAAVVANVVGAVAGLAAGCSILGDVPEAMSSHEPHLPVGAFAVLGFEETHRQEDCSLDY